jgi:hypothetical protein
MNRACRSVLVFAALAAWLPPASAGAAECGTENPSNPIVYVFGTAKPYLAALGRALYRDSQPITMVWVGRSSCIAVDSILNATPLTGDGTFWDPQSAAPNNEVTCQLPANGGQGVVADVGVSDIFASSCVPLPNGLPNDVGDALGPVQTMTFIVPKASSERVISAAAAFFVYGFGADSGVAPWTDPSTIFRLDDTSGTQRIIAAGIGVPAEKWKGTNANYSAKLVTSLTSVPAASASSTLGILAATNIVDSLLPQINVLAYKHTGQSCGWYPDSSATSKDKRSVRDGHYALWGPIHVFSKLDSKGYPINPNARRVINYLTGASPPPGGLDLIQVAALNNLVPSCAMKVQREREMGPVSAFEPQNPCGCYFERVATGAAGCQMCTATADCPSSAAACSFGYCETQ